MSLDGSLSGLKSDLAAALDEKTKNGIDNIGKDQIISKFSSSMSKAIDKYSLEADIKTDVISPPAAIQTTSAGPSASPVIGTGKGTISDMDTSSLEAAIKSAHEKVVVDGSKDGADYKAIDSSLGKDLADGIVEYYMSALVTTEVELTAFMTIGIPPITPAAIAGGEKGEGLGQGGSSKGLTNLKPLAPSLASDLASSYDWAVTAGSASGAKTADVNKGLADRISDSIHNFIKSTIIMTDVTFEGATGETAPTSMMPGPSGVIPTVPPPQTIPGGTGMGIGNIA